jgi:hypothetical protein
MARIPLDPPRTFWYRIGSWVSRPRYGVMLDPGAALAHNMPVGRSYALFELQVERWRMLDRGLKDLAVMAASARIGCAWCLDFGYWEATMNHHVPAEKIRVPGQRLRAQDDRNHPQPGMAELPVAPASWRYAVAESELPLTAGSYRLAVSYCGGRPSPAARARGAWQRQASMISSASSPASMAGSRTSTA